MLFFFVLSFLFICMFPVSMRAKNKMAENLDPLLESQSVAPSNVPAAARILHSDFSFWFFFGGILTYIIINAS
uniref:Uncharacterized protein n=1 Tax=Anguilla anguilla TaxID=7936 RepID=A0A0E9XDY8_ANGAN